MVSCLGCHCHSLLDFLPSLLPTVVCYSQTVIFLKLESDLAMLLLKDKFQPPSWGLENSASASLWISSFSLLPCSLHYSRPGLLFIPGAFLLTLNYLCPLPQSHACLLVTSSDSRLWHLFVKLQLFTSCILSQNLLLLSSTYQYVKLAVCLFTYLFTFIYVFAVFPTGM